MCSDRGTLLSSENEGDRGSCSNIDETKNTCKNTCCKAASLSWYLVVIYLTIADNRWPFYWASGIPEEGEGSKPVERSSEGH